MLYNMHFPWKTQGRAVRRVTFKLTAKMNARSVYVVCSAVLRGWWQPVEGMYINKEQIGCVTAVGLRAHMLTFSMLTWSL